MLWQWNNTVLPVNKNDAIHLNCHLQSTYFSEERNGNQPTQWLTDERSQCWWLHITDYVTGHTIHDIMTNIISSTVLYYSIPTAVLVTTEHAQTAACFQVHLTKQNEIFTVIFNDTKMIRFIHIHNTLTTDTMHITIWQPPPSSPECDGKST